MTLDGTARKSGGSLDYEAWERAKEDTCKTDRAWGEREKTVLKNGVIVGLRTWLAVLLFSALVLAAMQGREVNGVKSYSEPKYGLSDQGTVVVTIDMDEFCDLTGGPSLSN